MLDHIGRKNRQAATRLTWFFIFTGITALVLFISSCTSKPPQEQRQETYRLDHPEQTVVHLTNTGPEESQFFIDINQGWYLQRTRVAQRIKAQNIGQEAQARAAWRLVAKTTRNAHLTSARWLHAPEYLLNSAGYGFCDDIASALATIWQEMGLPSRIWHLGGHVVPEVNIGGKWQMYDPDLGLYYLSDAQQVLSVEAIAGGAARWVTNGTQTVDLQNLPSPVTHQEKFLRPEDNHINRWFLDSIPEESGQFILGPGARLSCCDYHPGYFPNKVVKISLPAGFKGLIKTPLILVDADGFTAEVESQIKASHYLLPSGEISIRTPLPELSHLYFLANRQWPALENENSLFLEGTRLQQLEVSFSPSASSGELADFHHIPSFDFKDYLTFLSIWPQLPKVQSLENLKATYHRYHSIKAGKTIDIQLDFKPRYEALMDFLKQNPEYEEVILSSLSQPEFLYFILEYFLKEYPSVQLPGFIEQTYKSAITNQPEQ
ncbi:hypothetical protein IX84_23700 [Phaeodactylibacter xiamenensis]|uniref:Transglutaminase-like domain-containing protein n=2 Tax=Phaeodactylibacter xiamenensis TaxID=1524460 RepID=A0A098S182_9BACT|nr:hypothetical protein IX84_23700 [Phaeodactylibacter xiamenensis]